MASSINASTSGAGGLISTADNTGILNLQTAGITAVTVDASQNVGIGTASPASKLDVSNGHIRLTSAYQVQWFNGASQLGSVLADSGSNLTFQTGSSVTERMRVDSIGRLLLAGTSAISGYQFTMYHTDTGGMAYKYNGTSEQNSCSFQNGNGQVGRIYTSGSNTTYSTSSDYRLKENVIPMTGALEKVAQLNPVTFTWKRDGKDGQGFIAHELQAIVPDCVGGTKDAVDDEGSPVYQDVDTSYLVATLTKAIQELSAKVDAQQVEINALKGAV